MELLILSSGILYIVFLIYEYYSLSIIRKGLRHIIHVNGTRGKSTVCRLIDAGLKAGGHKVFTKTTGTSPRMQRQGEHKGADRNNKESKSPGG